MFQIRLGLLLSQLDIHGLILSKVAKNVSVDNEPNYPENQTVFGTEKTGGTKCAFT
jgi:hypothetical protein